MVVMKRVTQNVTSVGLPMFAVITLHDLQNKQVSSRKGKAVRAMLSSGFKQQPKLTQQEGIF